jgi:hypothetical protein
MATQECQRLEGHPVIVTHFDSVRLPASFAASARRVFRTFPASVAA